MRVFPEYTVIERPYWFPHKLRQLRRSDNKTHYILLKKIFCSLKVRSFEKFATALCTVKSHTAISAAKTFSAALHMAQCCHTTYGPYIATLLPTPTLTTICWSEPSPPCAPEVVFKSHPVGEEKGSSLSAEVWLCCSSVRMKTSNKIFYAQ